VAYVAADTARLAALGVGAAGASEGLAEIVVGQLDQARRVSREGLALLAGEAQIVAFVFPCTNDIDHDSDSFTGYLVREWGETRDAGRRWNQKGGSADRTRSRKSRSTGMSLLAKRETELNHSVYAAKGLFV
jgi:hypothetical protein